MFPSVSFPKRIHEIFLECNKYIVYVWEKMCVLLICFDFYHIIIVFKCYSPYTVSQFYIDRDIFLCASLICKSHEGGGLWPPCRIKCRVTWEGVNRNSNVTWMSHYMGGGALRPTSRIFFSSKIVCVLGVEGVCDPTQNT